MKKLVLLFILSLFSLTFVKAQQPLNVDVHVSPPYQLNLDGLSNQLLVTVTNTSNTVITDINFKIELHGPMQLTIQGTNVLVDDFDLNPGEIKQFIGGDWDNLYDPEDLSITPDSERQRIIDTQSLREGNYQVCLTAINSLTGAVLSGGVPNDCINIVVEAPQPPVIVFPQNNFNIPLEDFIMQVNWTQANLLISPTYLVQIVDITQIPNTNYLSQEIFNIAPMVYEESDIEGFSHTVEDVLWQNNHNYLIRVTARFGDNEGILYDYKIHSVPVMFTYSNIQQDNDETQQAQTDDNEETQEEVALGTPTNIQIGDTILVGKNGEFKMILTKINGTNTSYTGEGEIYIDWLQNKIKTKFSNISVDNNRKITQGKVFAKAKQNAPAYPKLFEQSNNNTNNWTNQLVNNVDNWVYNNSNNPNEALKTPINLSLNPTTQIILTEMQFDKDNSMLNAITIKNTPLEWNSQQQTIGYITKENKFHPNQIQETKRFKLVENLQIDDEANDNHYTYLKPDNNRQGCFIDWNTNGFTKYGVEIETELSRDIVIPKNDNGTNKAKIRLSSQTTTWDELILAGNLDPCLIPNTDGLEISATNIFYDMSDVLNPPGIAFPSNYQGEKSVLFRGFFAKNLKLKLPPAWDAHSNGQIEINLNNMIIDSNGITLKAEAVNIADFNTTDVVDMAASIDKASVEILNNNLTEAKIEGKLALPLSDVETITDESKVNYVATLHLSQPQTNNPSYFQLSLNPTENQEIDIDLIESKLKINNNSNIVAYLGTDKKTFSVDLNGEIEITGDVEVGSFSLKSKKMKVEHLEFSYDTSKQNKFSFNPQNRMSWSLSSPQKALVTENDNTGFPVTFTGIDFSEKTPANNEYLRGSLDISARINLAHNVAGRTTFELVGAVEKNNANHKFKPKYVETNISEISVNADLKAVKINGTINVRNDDPVYGDGFKGNLTASFVVPKATVGALAEFGKVNGYRYWRVQAGTKFTTPIPLAALVAFYGFGGGAYNNMQAVKNTNTNAPLNEKYIFTPKKDRAGFNVEATIGGPKFETFNSDIAISAQINSGENGGIENINFNGNLWVGGAGDLSDIQKIRNGAPIKGQLNVSYDFVNKIFDLNSSVNVNVTPIKANNVGIKLYVNGTTDKWFFNFGTPSKPNTVTVGIDPFKIDVGSYFMFGNDIEIPDAFTTRFANGYKNVMGNYPGFEPTTDSTNEDSYARKGSGIALGIGFDFEAGGYLHVIDKYYVGAKGTAGAELNLSLLEYPLLKQYNKGYNGWQVGGSLGFYAKVGAGVYSKKGSRYIDEFLLAEFGGAGYVSGKFPNPTHVKGEIGGRVKILCAWDLCLFDESVSIGFDYGEEFDPGPPDVETIQAVEDVNEIEVLDPIIEEMDKHIIKYIHPEAFSGVLPDTPIAVKYSVVPNETFEIEGINGEPRIFKFHTIVTLQEQNPLECEYTNIPVTSYVNDIGERMYIGYSQLTLPNSNNTPVGLVQTINNQQPNSPQVNTNVNQNYNNNIGLNSYYSGNTVQNRLAPNTLYKFTVATVLKEFIDGKWEVIVFQGKNVEEVITYQFRTAETDTQSQEEIDCDNLYTQMTLQEIMDLTEEEREARSNEYVSADGKCECPRQTLGNKYQMELANQTNQAQQAANNMVMEENLTSFDDFMNQNNGAAGIGTGGPPETTQPTNNTLVNPVIIPETNFNNVNQFSMNTFNFNNLNTFNNGSFDAIQQAGNLLPN